MLVLGAVGLFALLLLVGHLLYRAFAPSQEESSWAEVLFVQFFAGVLLCGWLALLLAELGLFSLLHLLLLLGAVGVVVAAWRWRRVRSWRWPPPRFSVVGLGVLLLFVILGVFLLYPGEWVLGGQDPGVYVSVGASIARTGGIVVYEPWIVSLPAEARSQVLPYYVGQWWQLPGFYVTDFTTGQITPQFFHLYPTWLAVFHAVGGLQGTLAATPLITLLGLVCFYFLTRRLFAHWPAVVAVLLLALNPAQVWFARQPAAETLLLPLLFGGWYLLERATTEPDRRELAALAGLALGQVALAKIEFVSLSVLLYGYLMLRWVLRRLRANDNIFLTVYTFLVVHAAAHVVLIARPYLRTMAASLEQARLPLDPALMVVLVVLLSLGGILILCVARRPLAHLLVRLRAWPRMRQGGFAGLWLLVVLYGAVLAPVLAPARLLADGTWHDNLERLSFLRLAWYLSPAGLVLGVAGLLWWFRRRLRASSLPFLAGFVLLVFLYTYRAWAYPYHFWMMRRYVSLVLPCLTLGIALALWRVRLAPLGRAVRRGGALVLLGLLLLLVVQVDRSFASRRELAGTSEALAQLAAELPDDAPVLVEQLGSALATPLRYVYGKRAFALITVNPFEDASRAAPLAWAELWSLLQRWPVDSGPVYMLLEQIPAELRGGLVLRQVSRFDLDVELTENSYDHLPRDAVTLRSAQGVYEMRLRPEAPATLEVYLDTPDWTGGRLAVDLPAPSQPLVLRMRVAGFRPEPLPSARLQVFWQGQELGVFMLKRSWEFEEIEVELPVPTASDEAHLVILCETWNPRQAGYNEDTRDLGFLLQALVLAEKEGGRDTYP